MINPDTPISELPGIGPVRRAAFEKLGIFCAKDLIMHFPRGYQHRGDVKMLSDTGLGENSAFILTVGTIPRTETISRQKRMSITRFNAFDESGKVSVVFFNRPYLSRDRVFEVGERYRFYGKLTKYNNKLTLNSPIFEPYKEGVPLPAFVPIYPLTAGLKQKFTASCIEGVITAFERNPDIYEPISEGIRRKTGICGFIEAARAIHFPESYEDIDKGRRYFVFSELLKFALCIESIKSENTSFSYNIAEFTDTERLADEFTSALNFTLTGAQKRAIADISADLSSGSRMDRLIYGDVGSGKTICAVAAAYLAAKNGWQTAFLVPTEVLAAQHYANIEPMLAKAGIKTALLTGSVKPSQKKIIYQDLENGEIDVCIGTHALLSEGVGFRRLGLTITDEQHRFGVRQRSTLTQQTLHEISPHILVMSATPIPRTLALIIYGDLKSSAIDELPPGRKKIDTFVVNSGYHERLIAFIKKLTDEGQQVYVICPAVGALAEELSEDDLVGGEIIPFPDSADSPRDGTGEIKSAIKYGQTLREELPELKIGILHGKMSSSEKESVMDSFAAGETQLLVATTVIEVGIDVPNATLMIVENAERFGLSQLHQLRGRVGRGKQKSYCVLVSDTKSETAVRRLSIMKETNDGFKIAETDLSMRGPGEFLPRRDGGAMQHGVSDFGITMSTDTETLNLAMDIARELLSYDPKLERPENKLLGKEIQHKLNSNIAALN
ncbi:MAG: ATP-dependent DNA helicase RecG [Clostridiales bacterium]|jgi:ATP-dependent DNA helicase RecG|nr:ATP-dependent DNA helicase RecG [Clostridiales bacterium]